MVVSRHLNYIRKHLNKLVEKTSGEVHSVANQLAKDIHEEIEAFKVAYADSLNLTVDKLDPLVRGWLEKINQRVEHLEKKIDKVALVWPDFALNTSLSVPFMGNYPKVTRWSPKYVFGKENAIIHFHGIFPLDSNPKLRIQDKVIEPYEHINTQISFSIPKELYAEVKSPRFIKGELRLTERSQVISCISSRLTFKTTLVAFPEFAGKLSILTHEQEKPETVNLRWGETIIRGVKPNKWKICFDAYNNSHYEFIGTTLNNPILEVSDLKDRVKIFVKGPRMELLHLRHVVDQVSILKEPEQKTPPTKAPPPPVPPTKTSPPLVLPTKAPPPVPQIHPFRAALGHLPHQIQSNHFQSSGQKIPAAIKKSYPYLYKEHIHKKSTQEVRIAPAHKAIAIYKSGKWRFYWLGPPSSAIVEKKGGFQKAFDAFKPKYLEMARKPYIASRL
ncbi:hypothetical protein [Candidatus Neptunochlamydia vexilliferae]|uniref:Uncharacterized protein n=1 Tax=Candidatus Neptunichlamydia vexilliferae TaxID=1651774 RepID=A0ABS0AXH4_9BACT|nr:hypothetical protein [Candidatus Neptunochlamydia vexilliferae]MBF5058659.1 hypothetical protein [Candidatus Neptunochlamydia vexilliferae]